MQSRELSFRRLPVPCGDLYESGLWWRDAFYWVDILESSVLRYDPRAEECTSIRLPEYVGTIAPIRGDWFVAALQNGIHRFNFVTGESQLICTLEPDLQANRANDGKCDPAGRLWVGTMELSLAPECGSLYSLEEGLPLEKKLDRVTVSNGMAWSADHRCFYFIDTMRSQVDAFGYDLESGAIADRRVACKIPKEMGYPDGMNIDEEGMLWVALWGGAAVTRWDPDTGELLARYPLPVSQITNCTFGGSNLNELYVTTAKSGLTSEQLEAQPLAGSVFVLDPGTRGLEPFRFKVA